MPSTFALKVGTGELDRQIGVRHRGGVDDALHAVLTDCLEQARDVEQLPLLFGHS